jgi:Na+/citrate or Na+/malate symporter
MGLIETVLYIVLVVLVLQLIFSFFNLDRRIVGIIIVLVILGVFFGHQGGHFRRVQANAPSEAIG